MKKAIIGLILLAGFIFQFQAAAKDSYGHNASVLPKAAQSIIKKNFKAKVGVVKIDKDFGRISEYDATLTDGSEITFDRDGNWKEVETNIDKSVPSAFIPSPIMTYVKKNNPGTRIVGIEKDRNGYDVTLSNGIDIEFDRQGNFIRYD